MGPCTQRQQTVVFFSLFTIHTPHHSASLSLTRTQAPYYPVPSQSPQSPQPQRREDGEVVREAVVAEDAVVVGHGRDKVVEDVGLLGAGHLVVCMCVYMRVCVLVNRSIE